MTSKDRLETRFLLQPSTSDHRTGDALSARARTATALWVMSAWAQESGVNHLRPIIDNLHGRGGRAEAIVGLDYGFATYEGLRAAREVFDVVYVFHDGARTFHPKLYAIENDVESRVVIGSGNMTEGGLYVNFEAATVVDLDRTMRRDEAIRAELRAHFDSFTAEGMPFRRLDRDLLKELRAGGALLSAAGRKELDNEHRRRGRWLRGVFGNPVAGLPTAPAARRPTTRAATVRTRERTARATPASKPLFDRLLDELKHHGFEIKPRDDRTTYWIKLADSHETVGEIRPKTLYLRFKYAIPGAPKIKLEGVDKRWAGKAVYVRDDNLTDCLAHFQEQAARGG